MAPLSQELSYATVCPFQLFIAIPNLTYWNRNSKRIGTISILFTTVTLEPSEMYLADSQKGFLKLIN